MAVFGHFRPLPSVNSQWGEGFSQGLGRAQPSLGRWPGLARLPGELSHGDLRLGSPENGGRVAAPLGSLRRRDHFPRVPQLWKAGSG